MALGSGNRTWIIGGVLAAAVLAVAGWFMLGGFGEGEPAGDETETSATEDADGDAEDAVEPADADAEADAEAEDD